MDLGVIMDAYALFAQFNIFVPQDDYDKVDSLQYSFNRMLENVSKSLYLLSYISNVDLNIK